MGRLLYFLGGAAIGLIAPKVVSLVKDFYDENLREAGETDVDTEVENGIKDPDAVIVPIHDEGSEPVAAEPEPDPA